MKMVVSKVYKTKYLTTCQTESLAGGPGLNCFNNSIPGNITITILLYILCYCVTNGVVVMTSG